MLSEHFTYREPVSINEGALQLDGFYFETDTREDGALRHFAGTLIYPLMLWSDGTAASFGAFGRELEEESAAPLHFGTEDEALAEFENYLREDVTGKRGGFARWGAFRLRSDSISIQIMMHGAGGRPFTYLPIEYNGVVLDDTTFVITESVYHYSPYAGVEPLARVYRFKHFEPKPPSANWTDEHPKLQ